MVRLSLERLVDSVLAARCITDADVKRLRREVLPDGPDDRDEVDVLIALDRAIADKDAEWAPFLVQTVVDFVVWLSRPTGAVDHGTATWLVASLRAGIGPTPLAEAVAFEVVREAERADMALLTFVMRSVGGRLSASAAANDDIAPDHAG